MNHKTAHYYSSGPPPYLLFANLIDVRKINPDGTGDQTLVKDPRGTIIALDYDPVQNKVRHSLHSSFHHSYVLAAVLYQPKTRGLMNPPE